MIRFNIVGDDPDIKRYYWTKYPQIEGDTEQNIILSITDRIDVKEMGFLGEIGIRKFCFFDQEKLVIVKNSKKLILPFEKIGRDPLTIQCEKGFSPDWLRLLVEGLIGYHLLAKGQALLHSGSVNIGEYAILYPAWRTTGKTSLTLNLLKDNCGYIGDDYVVLSSDGFVELFSDACHVNFTHLRYLAQSSIFRQLKSSLVEWLLDRFQGSSYISKVARHIILRISWKKFVKVKNLIDKVRVCYETYPVRKVFLIIQGEEFSIKETNPESIIQRMVGMNAYERKEFLQYYEAFKYATGKNNIYVERGVELETQILKAALKNAVFYEVMIHNHINYNLLRNHMLPKEIRK